MKQSIAQSIASLALKNRAIEELLCYLCSQEYLRKNLKLGGLAFGYVYALNNLEIRVAQLPGYKMYVNIAEPLGIVAYFFRESGTYWFISQLISQGDMCIDAGANMGHYTFLMAAIVGKQGKVVAFEPQPNYLQMISDSISLNSWQDFVSVESKALWNKSGEKLNFYLSENLHNSGTSSLINHGLYLNAENRITVETMTLEDYFQEQGISKCRLLKIDVERAEVQVLRGMLNLLKEQAIDYILLEMYAHSESQKILTDLDYTCFFVNQNLEKFLPISKIEPEYFGDYLFVSPKSLNNFTKKFAEIIV